MAILWTGGGGWGGVILKLPHPHVVCIIIKSIVTVLVSEIIKQTPHQFLLILRGVGWGSH